MKRIFTTAIMMLMLQLAVNADAAPSIFVDRVGTTNVYAVKGYDFADVGGVEVEIQYDLATLTNPRITQGPLLASTIFIPNPDCNQQAVKGRVCSALHNIKIVATATSPLKGSGDLATITFDLKSSNPGPVYVVNRKMTTVKAEKITPVDERTAAQVALVNSETELIQVTQGEGGVVDPQKLQTAQENLDVAKKRVTDSQNRPIYTGTATIGTITLPADQAAVAEAGKTAEYQPLVTDLRKDMTQPLGDPEGKEGSSGEKTVEPAKEQQKKSVSYASTLQLFKEFKGEKSSRNLIPLFAEISPPDFKQEPPIAFSDGTTHLKISLVIKPSGSEAPKFFFEGASVKQLNGAGEESITWTIEAIPKKDVVEAVLTVIDGQTTLEFPLTVVPRINPLLTKAKALSEADFATYLAKPPRFDLNKDGKFDAVDDFIYTANFIAAMKITPEKAIKEEKAAPPKPEGTKEDPKAKEPLKGKDEKAKTVEKPAEKIPVQLPVKPPVKQ